MEYWILIVIILVIILVIVEYLYQDCINGTNSKKGWNRAVPPKPTDDLHTQFETILRMIRCNYNYVIWRQCLIVALLAGLLVGVCLFQRLPTLFEFIVISLIVFVLTYAAGGWFSTHYLYPNNCQLERSLRQFQSNLEKSSTQL